MTVSNFVTEVDSGDERRALEALRHLLAGQILLCEPNVVAQVAARLQSVIERLGALPPAIEESDPLDDIARRREARRAATKLASLAAQPGAKRGKRSS